MSKLANILAHPTADDLMLIDQEIALAETALNGLKALRALLATRLEPVTSNGQAVIPTTKVLRTVKTAAATNGTTNGHAHAEEPAHAPASRVPLAERTAKAVRFLTANGPAARSAICKNCLIGDGASIQDVLSQAQYFERGVDDKWTITNEARQQFCPKQDD